MDLLVEVSMYSHSKNANYRCCCILLAVNVETFSIPGKGIHCPGQETVAGRLNQIDNKKLVSVKPSVFKDLKILFVNYATDNLHFFAIFQLMQ